MNIVLPVSSVAVSKQTLRSTRQVWSASRRINAFLVTSLMVLLRIMRLETLRAFQAAVPGKAALAGAVAGGDNPLVANARDGIALDENVIESRGRGRARVVEDFDDDAAGALGQRVAVRGTQRAANVVDVAVADVDVVNDRVDVVRAGDVNAAPLAVARGVIDHLEVVDFPEFLVHQEDAIGGAAAIDQRTGAAAVGAEADHVVGRAGTFGPERALPTAARLEENPVAGRERGGVDLGECSPGDVGSRCRCWRRCRKRNPHNTWRPSRPCFPQQPTPAYKIQHNDSYN